jgi:hypothetical protein
MKPFIIFLIASITLAIAAEPPKNSPKAPSNIETRGPSGPESVGVSTGYRDGTNTIVTIPARATEWPTNGVHWTQLSTKLSGFSPDIVYYELKGTNYGLSFKVETNWFTSRRVTIEEANRPPSIVDRLDGHVETNLYLAFTYKGREFTAIIDTLPCTNCPAFYREVSQNPSPTPK